MLRAIVLGIVQGITEFLPISSSAHLSIVPRLLGYATPTLAFEILLHFGTLAAVAAYFARDLWAFVLCLVAPGRLGPEEAGVRRRLLGLLALASVPAAAVGFLLQDWADEQTTRPLRASVWLVLTTVIMIAAELYDRARSRREAAVAAAADGEPGGAVRASRGGRTGARGGRGGAEAAAGGQGGRHRPGPGPRPGARTSRSGVTISAGLFQGVSRGTAARFSFLLSIPAILGAGILKLDELSGATETPAELVAGTVAAGVSGFLAVSFLLRVLRTRTLWPFIWYRLVAGGLFVLLLATVRS